MTDIIQNQDVELTENNENVVEAHDPKNAEDQSVDSVDKADDAVKPAPVPKTKAGMVNAMVQKMGKMKKPDLMAAYEKMMGESVEIEDEALAESADFDADVEALIMNEDSLSEEFKTKAATIFEAAVKSRVDEAVTAKMEEMDAELAEKVKSLEEQYAEEISEGLVTTKEELVEKIDSYLGYVVETWMEENRLAVERGLRTEIAETFMSKMKDLFVESYIEVPESKVDLVDELSEQVEELEGLLNKETSKNIEMKEAADNLKKEMIIREASKDLAETQVSKLEKLAESVDFEDEATFAEKVATLKESYFSKTVEEAVAIVEEVEESEEAAEEISTSSSMDRYLSALRQS